MKLQTIITTVLLFLVTYSLASQELISINTTNNCTYTNHSISSELYSFKIDTTIEKAVLEICEAANIDQNFRLVSSNVPTVAAIIDSGKKYILYSKSYFTSIKGDRYLYYALLAHEIGHIAMHHDLNASFRLREELAAEEFVGKTLYNVQGIDSLERLKKVVSDCQSPIEDSTRLNERLYSLEIGWYTAEAIILSEDNLAFFESDSTLNKFPIPLFNMAGCPKGYQIPVAHFNSCNSMKEVNQSLQKALDARGYEQKSYYCIKNGFAVAVPIEQIHENGICLVGQARWQDFPSRKRFDGILNYLSSMIWPYPGYFRLFVFLVTDTHIQNSNNKISTRETRAWPNCGGFWLPKQIESIPFTPQHKVTALVYEFESPESTKRLNERCGMRLLSAREHLEKAGLLTLFNN